MLAEGPNSIAQANGLGRKPTPHNTRPNGPLPQGAASHGPLGLWDRVRRTRSPGLRPGLSGLAPLGPWRGRGSPTQRRPNANVPRGKVWAFGPLRLAASGTKTPPQNRRSFPNNRRGFSSPDGTYSLPADLPKSRPAGGTYLDLVTNNVPVSLWGRLPTCRNRDKC